MKRYTARPYQQAAHDAAIAHMRRSTEPCLIEAATGAGKSIIIAMLAETLHSISGGKRVLCLAPSRELVLQNSAKYAATGEPFSIFSASIEKSLRHHVIFATEGTFKKVAKRMGKEFTGVVLDEAHRITPTIRGIIDDMREGNPHLRVVGMTATPYRLGEGYIYAQDAEGRAYGPDVAREPYFTRLVYAVRAKELIDAGFLTPVSVGIGACAYDTSELTTRSDGQFTTESIDRAFHGHGRLTADIVADIVAKSQGRKGVMIFAATVRHAQEVMASLPPELSRMLGGDINMRKKEREELVADFHAQKYKYLVSVGTMTTGVDFSHVDVIALMRATESVSLMQQMIGRGLRLHPDKKDCLLLDFAGNVDRHSPDGDVFVPQIKATAAGAAEPMEAVCPKCEKINIFSERPNDEGFGVDEFGYFLLADGSHLETEQGPMPAHYGRRCQHGEPDRCEYRWTCKTCECGTDNDIAARYCTGCSAELVDPNEKLEREFKALKRDASLWQVDRVESAECYRTQSRAGNHMFRAKIRAGGRWMDFYIVYTRQGQVLPWAVEQAEELEALIRSDSLFSIRYRKDGDFWRLGKCNLLPDDEMVDMLKQLS